MRKGRDRERKKMGKTGGEKKRMMKIVATMSLPAVDRPNTDRWNAARSCQKKYFTSTRVREQLTKMNKDTSG